MLPHQFTKSVVGKRDLFLLSFGTTDKYSSHLRVVVVGLAGWSRYYKGTSEGFGVTMHESTYKWEVQIPGPQAMFARVRVHCGKKAWPIGHNHEYNMAFDVTYEYLGSAYNANMVLRYCTQLFYYNKPVYNEPVNWKICCWFQNQWTLGSHCNVANNWQRVQRQALTLVTRQITYRASAA